MAIIVASILLLLNARSVCAGYAGESNYDLTGSFGYAGRERRAHASLPKFSKKENGKGYIYEDYYEHFWTYHWKSEKKSKSSKSSKKDKKEGKKDKKAKYYWDHPTKVPTVEPAPSPAPLPTVSDPPIDHGSGSDSEDMHPSTGSSEDCPPARPPTVIPPTQGVVSKNPTMIDEENVKYVALDVYAVDYTLVQTDRSPIRDDFILLQKITEEFFKDHMLNAYKVSTQANLIDFKTSFVTARFTPGEPAVHIQFNSTASFDEESINVPSADTLFTVLEESLEDPKSYIDLLKSQLSDLNPFSRTSNIVFTDPKETSNTRSATGAFGIAGAGVAMILTLTIVGGVVHCRKAKNSADCYDEYNESFSKHHISSDATVAGETFVSEINDSIYDGSISVLSAGLAENYEIQKSESSLERNMDKFNQQSIAQTSSRISDPLRRPRTVAEIENLLCSLDDGDTI